jgi:hypothetical protein
MQLPKDFSADQIVTELSLLASNAVADLLL